MKYAIVYSSRTGNTKMLADTIRTALPKEDCVYFGTASEEALKADRIYVGFWTDKGACDADTAAFLKTVKDHEVYLFGTAGFGISQEYFDKIVSRAAGLMDQSNKLVGSYMCQGKMPLSVRERYMKMKELPNCPPNMDQMIENFDNALTHPDQNDLAKLDQAVKAL